MVSFLVCLAFFRIYSCKFPLFPFSFRNRTTFVQDCKVHFIITSTRVQVCVVVPFYACTIVVILSMTKVIENRKLFLISFLFWFLEFLCQHNTPKFLENHAHVTVDWSLHCCLCCHCCLYFVLCDDFNDKYFISIIAHSGDYRDVHALIGQGLHHILP